MHSYSFDLTGKKAIVTGAGRGIGKALALGLAKAGADVVVCARTLADVEAMAVQIKKLGRKSIAIKVDVRSKEDVENLFKKTLEGFGDIDILVNNAGGSFNADFMDLSEKAWDSVIRENLTPIFLCCKEAGKIMTKNKKGSIINIASVAGIMAQIPRPAYGAAKAAVINITQTLATRWAPDHVRVNAISPGYIETEWVKDNFTPDQIKLATRDIPLGRYGTSEEIVGGVIYLASDASSYVTGINLIIAGGFAGPAIV